jgi:hypothetical protein
MKSEAVSYLIHQKFMYLAEQEKHLNLKQNAKNIIKHFVV